MFFKNKKKDLKIQDVSADCPDYKDTRGKDVAGDEFGKTKKRRMRKIRAKRRHPLFVIFLILLLLAAGAVGFYFWGIPLLGGSSVVYVERVSNIMGLGSGNGTLNRYAGIVESQGEWIVNLDGSKNVKEIYVQEGESVEAGDELFAYDKEAIELNLQQARLEMERMESEIEAANSQIQALESQKEYASSSQILEIEIQIQSFKANNKKVEYEMKNQQTKIESLEKSVENTVVKSELTGVVKKIDRSVLNGDLFGETEFIRILATGDYRIKASVNEQNQWSLEEGMEVIVRSRVDSNKIWTGKILSIQTNDPQKTEQSSNSDEDSLNRSSSYPFYVKLDSSAGLLLGQHVYIEPNKGQDIKKDGVWLEGYYFIQEEDKTFVWIESRIGLLEKREVTLGQFQEELGQYEILSGINREDYIAFPTEELWTGMRTTKEKENDSTSEDSKLEENQQFEMEEDSFQQFQEGMNHNSDEDNMGPVGSLDGQEEVRV